MSKVFAIAAHPDDEILDVGGTVRNHIDKGDEIYALVLGEGQTSRWSKRELADPEALKKLHEDSYKAAEVIGFKDVYFESLPHNRFDSVTLLDVVKIVEGYIRDIKPDVIYTHHSGDLSVVHQVTYKAVFTATRPIGDYCVKEIYGFETVSSTEWYFGSKENSFFPQIPHPSSIKMLNSLAEVRGAVVRAHKAEAFEVIYIVEKKSTCSKWRGYRPLISRLCSYNAA